MNDIKSFVEKYAALLPLGGSLSSVEYERRAGEFLAAMATITNVRHMLTADKIRLTSVQTAVYANQMSKGAAKTVTENKLNAEASEECLKAREELEGVENDITYLKAYYEIFQNAHVMYRNLAKGESF